MDHAPLHHSEVQRDVDDMEICFLCRLEVYYKLGGLGQADSNIKCILEIKKQNTCQSVSKVLQWRGK